MSHTLNNSMTLFSDTSFDQYGGFPFSKILRKIKNFLIELIVSKVMIYEPSKFPVGFNKIILTFDDGPNSNSSVSVELLKVLENHRVQAVFCYAKQNIKENLSIVQQTIENKHLLAVHIHPDRLSNSNINTCKPIKKIIKAYRFLRLLLDAKLFEERLDSYISLIKEVSNNQVESLSLIRPPYGVKYIFSGHKKVLDKNNIQYAYITIFANDAKTEICKSYPLMRHLKQSLLKNRGGAIVLHESRYDPDPLEYNMYDKSWLPNAVDELIRWAKQEGFTFTTYPQLSSLDKLPKET